MQRLPVDSITHVLAFCDAHGLAAATAVCREWESIVATPSMAQSQLWAALAAHSWHAAHRLHAPLLHADEDAEGDAPDDDDQMDEAAEEAAGGAALAAMHTAVPPQPQLAPWMPGAIGYRELLLFSTQWPTRVDASTPAVFCRHADQHQMMMRPVPSANAYMRALDGALAKEEARKLKHKQKMEAAALAAKRLRGANASGAEEDGASGAEDAAMADDGEDDEDSSSDDDDDADEGDEDEDDELDSDAEDELLQAVLQDEEAFTALMRERIGADLRQYVEEARVQMAVQRRRAMAAGARQGQRAATRAAAATAAAPAAAAPTAASPSDAAASASKAEAAPAARPGVRRRAQANGPSPAQTAAEAAAIAAAEAKIAALEAESKDEGADAKDDADADADADGADLAIGVEDDADDAEVDMDDGLDEDLDAEDEVDDDVEEEEDAEDAEDEEDEEGEDFDDYDTSSSDDAISESEGGEAAAAAERAQVEQAISADLDAEHRVHALFQLGREAAALPKLADRTRAVAELLQGEEAAEIFSLLRQNGLRRLELQQRREKRRAQRLLRDATFELGCLTRPVSADPAQQSEPLPPLEQHLIRIAYAGTRTGGDRSVRADAVFPTRIPGHATPFTSLCWVRRERWEQAVADAAAQSDMRAKVEGDDGKFVKATALLTADSSSAAAASAAAAPGQKRKLTATSADAASPSASAAPAPKPNARASKRGAEPPKKRKTDPSASASASASAGLGSLDSEDEDEPESAQAASSSSSSSAELGAYVPVVRLSMLAYFEVLIQRERVHHGSKKSHRGGRGASAFPVGAEQCVAIGLGSSRFRLHGKQPGWDANSFGFHSDDGSVFHGSGTASSAYCAGGFGVGDVVGAGLDYTKGVVFFTKNGRYLGPAFSAPLVPLSLYPLVGLDAVYDVVLNFGDAFPFAFDVLAYERDTMARLDVHVPRALGEPEQPQIEQTQRDNKAPAQADDVSFDESGRLAEAAAFQSELASYRDPAFIGARDAALAEARRGAPPQSQPQPADSGLSFMDLVAQEQAKDSEHAKTGQKQCDNKAADEDEGMVQEAEEEPSAASSSSSTSASASANSRAPVLQLVDAYCAFIKAKWRHLAPSSSP